MKKLLKRVQQLFFPKEGEEYSKEVNIEIELTEVDLFFIVLIILVLLYVIWG